MTRKSDSIYFKQMNLQGEITITLNADERMMICEALGKCAPKEVDILPLALLMDRIMSGRVNERKDDSQ